MDESLTEQRRVYDEGLRIVKYCLWGRMMHLKLPGWSSGEESGIPGVEVKFVDIGRNTGGEGGSLVRY